MNNFSNNNNNNRLLDITLPNATPVRQLMNSSSNQQQEFQHQLDNKNTTKLLYMTNNNNNSGSMSSEQLNEDICDDTIVNYEQIENPNYQTFDINDDLMLKIDDSIDTTLKNTDQNITQAIANQIDDTKPRLSFGLDLTECTLDCSIDLCDSSVPSSAAQPSSPSGQLKKQNSFEMDESLGILTPDQMKEFLDSTNTSTNTTNICDGQQNQQHQKNLPLNAQQHQQQLLYSQQQFNNIHGNSNIHNHHPQQHSHHHHQQQQHHHFPQLQFIHNHNHPDQACRIDLTPSPEELPLDPVEVKTDLNDILLLENNCNSDIRSNINDLQHQGQQQQHLQQQQQQQQHQQHQQLQQNFNEISQTDSYSKTDQMTKSSTSKVSNSFITSITSITSLDTGYQGDGEMSRPGSRSGGTIASGPCTSTSSGSTIHNSSFGNIHENENNINDDESPIEILQIQHDKMKNVYDNDRQQINNVNDRQQLDDQQLQQNDQNYNENNPPMIVRRTQDSMTDSDFFTESDADDVYQRGGDRRAQIIDGHLYGAMNQQHQNGNGVGGGGGGGGGAGGGGGNGGCIADIGGGVLCAAGNIVYINQAAEHTEDSCMESSGIFTDVENRADEDLIRHRIENDSDMSPDGSTDTIKSNATEYDNDNKIKQNNNLASHHEITCNKNNNNINYNQLNEMNSQIVHVNNCNNQQMQQQCMSDSTTSTTLNSSSSCSSYIATCINDHNQNKNDVDQLNVISTDVNSSKFIDAMHSNIDNKKSSIHNINNNKNTSTNTSTINNNNNNVSKNKNIDNKNNIKNIKIKKTSPSRKQNKNEANVALKKQHDEMLSKRCSITGSDNIAVVDNGSNNSNENNSAATMLIINNNSNNQTNKLKTENYSNAGSDSENQENKRPNSMNLTSGLNSSSNNNNNNNSVNSRKIVPNKWDAVMNKIAVNKTTTKSKNYSDVKSKVTCGLRKNASTSHIPSSPQQNHHQQQRRQNQLTTNGGHNNSTSSLTAIRRRTSTSKRGRAHSKDSTRSSQSDISLSSGSPKAHPKLSCSSRSAKKRDVRTISISPSDLGPPSKNNGVTKNNANNKSITLHKRISSNGVPQTPNSNSNNNNNNNTTTTNANATNATIPLETKGSPTFKKPITIRRPVLQSLTKSPVKDHNRIVVSSPNTTNQQISSNNKIANNVTTTSATITATVKPHVKSLVTSSTPPASSSIGAHQQQLASQQYVQRNGSGTIIHHNNKNDSIINNQKSNLVINGHHHPHQYSNGRNSFKSNNKKLLNGDIHCDNNSTNHQLVNNDVPSNTKIDPTNLLHANKGIEAFGTLIQHLVFNLDAFACPALKKAQETTTKSLLETRLLLDDTRTACQNLEYQLTERETFFVKREKDLQELRNSELSRVENCITELQRKAKERIQSLETELHQKQQHHDNELKAYVNQTEQKFNDHSRELEEYKQRESVLMKDIQVLSSKENELRDKVVINENEFAERLLAAGRRERELSDKILLLNKQLEDLNKKGENRERELEERLHLSQDELTVLRQSRNSLLITNESTVTAAQKHQGVSNKKSMTHNSSVVTPTTTICSPSWNSVKTNGETTPSMNAKQRNPQMLQDEIESLRCVLELKQSEISDLRKQNHELHKAAEELPLALIKISSLESRLEDLKIQLHAKCEEEKDLIQKNKQLHDTYTHEMKNRKRLLLHNEELQWKLKQNSEKFSIALTELSKNHPDHSSLLNETKVNLYFGPESTPSYYHQHNNNNNTTSNSSMSDSLFNNSIMSRSNGSDKGATTVIAGAAGGEFFSMDDLSPPSSPMIKGVVEKSDSVSWVLEMHDDETPEVLASRMIRRAGSFRSSFNERINNNTSSHSQTHNTTPKRQLSHGNALSQSASATSITSSTSGVGGGRHHSDSSTTLNHQHHLTMPPSSSSQEHSVMKNSIKKQNSEPKPIALTKKIDIASWKEPLCSSSPNLKRLRTGDTNNITKIQSIEDKNLIIDAEGGEQHEYEDDDDVDDVGVNVNEISVSAPSTSSGIHFKRLSNPFKQNKRGLITCNAVALKTSQRVSEANLKQQQTQPQQPPTPQPSTLKELKKFQQIKESAGEAMVSGTNSEDEASIGSMSSSHSSDSGSLLSGTSSHSVGSYEHNNEQQANENKQKRHPHHRRRQQRQRQTSSNVAEDDDDDDEEEEEEDADLIINNIVASLRNGRNNEDDDDDVIVNNGDNFINNHNHHHHHHHAGGSVGTPMEVSWSEDGDQYPNNESIV